MKTKYGLILVNFVLVANLLLFGEGRDWSVEIKMEKVQWLPGEPIYVRVKATNETQQGLREVSLNEHLFLDNRICNVRHAIEDRLKLPPGTTGGGEPKLYPPGAVDNFYLRITYMCEGLKIGSHKEGAIGSHELCYKNINNKVCSQFEIIEPVGEDADLYAELVKGDYIFDILELKNLSIIVEKYPTSTYAGWVLINWKPELPGVFVVNESANSSIMAAISRNTDEINKWWKLSTPLPEGEQEIERTRMMRTLAEKIELFVNAHMDSQYSGYLMARAGINLLGLGEFRKACHMLSKSLELGWNLPKCNKECMKPHIEGTKNALDILKKNNICD